MVARSCLERFRKFISGLPLRFEPMGSHTLGFLSDQVVDDYESSINMIDDLLCN